MKKISSTSGLLHFWALWLAAALLLWPAASKAAAEVVELQQGTSVEQVEDKATFFLPDDLQPIDVDEAWAAYQAGLFTRVRPPLPDHATEEPELWVALVVSNPADADAEPLRRILGLGAWFESTPSVYIADEETQPTEILQLQAADRAELVPHYLNYLRTISFDIAPGQTRVLLIKTMYYEQASLGVFREGELGRNQVIAVALTGGFSVLLLLLSLLLFLIAILNGRPVGALMAIGFALVNLQADSEVIHRLLNLPFDEFRDTWRHITWLATGAMLLLPVFAFREAPPARWRLPIVVAICGAFAVAAWRAYEIGDTDHTLIPFYIALLLFTVTIAARFDVARNLRLATASVLFACIFAAFFVDYALSEGLPDLTAEFLMNLIRVTAAAAYLIFLLYDVRRSTRERMELIRGKLEAAERQAEADRKLLQTEREYARARSAASRRKAQLAAASHDIRQPIIGLRSALASEAENLSFKLRSQLDQAIGYLEELTREYSIDEKGQTTAGDTANEAYPVDLVVRAVHSMFANEAKDAGVAIEIRSSDELTHVPALALTRVLSNLVANALRHANASKIAIEVRGSGEIEIIVSDDGKGMDTAILEHVQKAGQKGETSDGDGLGLAIAHDLSTRHGFSFSISSAVDHGTTAILTVPGVTR